MPESGGTFIQSLVVAMGAVFGSCLRFKGLKTLSGFSSHKGWGTLIVNLLATFALGFLVGIRSGLNESNFSSLFFLAIGGGFLGGLSTFSAFTFQLFETLFERDFREFFLLLSVSLLVGFVVAAAGYNFGQIYIL